MMNSAVDLPVGGPGGGAERVAEEGPSSAAGAQLPDTFQNAAYCGTFGPFVLEDRGAPVITETLSYKVPCK